MSALQVALHALRTEHAAVERKVLPRLEADDLVVTHLQLNAALLTTEAAMRLDQPIRFSARREAHAGHGRSMRSESFVDLQWIDRDRRHGVIAPTLRDAAPTRRSTRVLARAPPAPACNAGRFADSAPRLNPSRR